jgi:hypothetical protein
MNGGMTEHDGKSRLDDPVSGKSFEYCVTCDTATVEGAMPKGALGLTYRITLRK